MSQVKFKTQYDGKKVEVMGGWDVPLKTYHLTVFDLNPGDEDEETLWCAMDHFGLRLTLQEMKDSLEKLGIQPPEQFFEICARKEGNVFFTYDDNGWNMGYVGF